MRDTDDRVREMVEGMERDVLAKLRIPVVYLGVPAFLLVVALSALDRSLSAWLLIETGAVLLLATVLLVPRPAHRMRTLLVVASITTIASMALLHYGPMLGTGILFVCATLAGAFFLGRGGGLVTTAALCAVMALTALASWRGWSTPVHSLPDGGAWARMAAATVIGLASVTYLFQRVHQASRDAVAAEMAARLREREAEAERERLLRSALAAQRLESLGRLAGGVAHDFNNALVIVKGGLDLLRESQSESERAELLEEIGEGAERAAATARQLLAFARRNAEDLGSCEPRQVIGRLASSLRRLFPATVSLRVQAEPTPAVPLASGALEQVLLNLALNGRDAMDGNGTLELSCHHDPDANEVQLAVTDDGVGMDTTAREHAFEPFFTTKGEGGTGLGLAMVWGVVTRHGGQVELESAPGRGTRVLLRFPPAPPAQTAEVHPAPEARPHETLRVLLLEDTDLVQRMIVRILTRAGYAVSAVETSAAAREELTRDSFAMLITDGIVPDGGVPAVIERFRAQRPGGPVLVCSGYLEEDLTFDGIARGTYRFLRKPFAPEELEGLVREMLSGTGATEPRPDQRDV